MKTPRDRFEAFLMKKYEKRYRELDDNMPDNFDVWICNLAPEEWLDYGTEWSKIETQGEE